MPLEFTLEGTLLRVEQEYDITLAKLLKQRQDNLAHVECNWMQLTDMATLLDKAGIKFSVAQRSLDYEHAQVEIAEDDVERIAELAKRAMEEVGKYVVDEKTGTIRVLRSCKCWPTLTFVYDHVLTHDDPCQIVEDTNRRRTPVKEYVVVCERPKVQP